MHEPDKIIQRPAPGIHRLAFRGDIITFTLELPPAFSAADGTAWVRTNIGHAGEERREVIREVIKRFPKRGRSWYDAPMTPVGERKFEVVLLLSEVGHFEAKCCFIPHNESFPLWPEGENTVLNVEPADTCCANIIYNAFVRQFGANKSGRLSGSDDDDLIQRLDRTGYTVIPKSGAFRDLEAELDHIVGELGCRIILLLPINPTPTTYARMGRFGSPYAALSHTAIDPALAKFDPMATPLEQFMSLADAIHHKGAKVFLDIAINHTGWAATLHETHPEWLVRDPEGRIENPGAWGVIWEDLTKLDYSNMDLWEYVADVFLIWCSRGVDGFRCDAGYMIPVPAWKYIIARVRGAYPDTIFFLEGLGGLIQTTRDLLNLAGFNWAYSELFQNYDRGQIENYLPLPDAVSHEEGLMVHFAETHDNDRLASVSQTYAEMRTALCALLSVCGGFGFANGVEWFAREKIDVHGSPSLNWGGRPNQVDRIRRLNAILTVHPAFHDQTAIERLQAESGACLAYLRRHEPTGAGVLILVNLDIENPSTAVWPQSRAGLNIRELTDLITGEPATPGIEGDRCTLELQPGQTLCLSDDKDDQDRISRHLEIRGNRFHSEHIDYRRTIAKAMDVYRHYRGYYVSAQDSDGFDPEEFARALRKDPKSFCMQMNHGVGIPEVVTWRWPDDLKRCVMVPPDHFLLVLSPVPFSGFIQRNRKTIEHEHSFESASGLHFCLFNPIPFRKKHTRLTLNLKGLFEGAHHIEAPLLLLSSPDTAAVKYVYSRKEIMDSPLLFMDTNGRGGMLRAHGSWGELQSRYDCLIGANLNPDFPEDRRIMLTRCRAWAVVRGFSQEIRSDCLEAFCVNNRNRGVWRFNIPAGQGKTAVLIIKMRMLPDTNAIQIHFQRQPMGTDQATLEDEIPFRLIIRPDIEDRGFHDTTKAYTGPEKLWPESVAPSENGFEFAPSKDARLEMQISRGAFTSEPEWCYMVRRPLEAARGLDPDSDLFSPGFFSIDLNGGDYSDLLAQVLADRETPVQLEPFPAAQEAASDFNFKQRTIPLKDALIRAIDHYVVKRGRLKTVIAGYPWFLDWGRDTLIVLRGLIAAGRTDEAGDALLQFAGFEDDGTIPNMIRGDDVGNRDTSDGPLWFVTACSELTSTDGNKGFLDKIVDPESGATIRDVIKSMGASMLAGTRNGVRCDSESGLLFSPSHFTWMDTNHPAGTPREGYPIEIQALWSRTLDFLARIDTDRNAPWAGLAAQVKQSILDLFVIEGREYLADCLHAQPYQPAREAEPDDALRPNQLYALALGAVNDMDICRKVLSACESLLVPGAIRSLANRPVKRPLPIYRDGALLNDPLNPYWGVYEGDEDTRRKPAYHNGTAWTFVMPVFCEAWALVYGVNARKTALSWLSSVTELMNAGCIGHVPEILDGDAPHFAKGCDAQAWGAAEFLRVWIKLAESTD